VVAGVDVGLMDPGCARGKLKRVMNVKCPTCKKSGDWFAGPFGPFCSRRCKLVDLGKWFSEEHLISRPVQPQDIESGQEQREPADDQS
jgi:hypothetical protein